MSTRDLIDAIQTGDSVAIQSAFEAAMASRIADRLDNMRQDVAKNMFVQQEQVAVEEEAKPKSVHPDALHVSHVGGGKYKVHAVGKNFSDGIKVGEHLSDTELDDFSEMGGKVKHVNKEETEIEEDVEQIDELSKDTVKRYQTRAQDDLADLKDMKKEVKRDIKNDPENAEFHKDTMKRTDDYIKRRQTGLARAKSRM